MYSVMLKDKRHGQLLVYWSVSILIYIIIIVVVINIMIIVITSIDKLYSMS